MCAVYVSFHSSTSVRYSIITLDYICVSLRLLFSNLLEHVLCSLSTALTPHKTCYYFDALVDPAVVARMENLGLYLYCPACHAAYATVNALKKHMDSHCFGCCFFIYSLYSTMVVYCKALISSALQAFGVNC